MAGALEQDVIVRYSVDPSDLINSLAEVNGEMDDLAKAGKRLGKELDAALKEMESGAQGAAEKVKALRIQQVENSRAQRQASESARELNKQLNNQNKEAKAADGSLTQLRAKLSNLKKAYADLSREERENAKVGGVLKNNIKSINDELKASEGAYGDFQRNVGDYRNGLSDALGVMGPFGQQIGTIIDYLQKLGPVMSGASRSVIGFGAGASKAGGEAGAAAGGITSFTNAAGGATKRVIGFGAASQVTAGETDNLGDEAKQAAVAITAEGVAAKGAESNIDGLGNASNKASKSIDDVSVSGGKMDVNLGKAGKTGEGAMQGISKGAAGAGVALGVVIGVILIVVDYLKRIDSVMDVVEQAVASFQAAWYTFLGGVGNGIKAIGELIKAVFSNPIDPNYFNRIAESATNVGKAFAGAATDAIKAGQAAADLTKALQDLEDEEAKASVRQVKRQGEINKLTIALKNRTLGEQEFARIKAKLDKLLQETDRENIALAEKRLSLTQKEIAAQRAQFGDSDKLLQQEAEALNKKQEIENQAATRDERLANLTAAREAKFEAARQAAQAKREAARAKAEEQAKKDAEALKKRQEQELKDAIARLETELIGIDETSDAYIKLSADIAKAKRALETFLGESTAEGLLRDKQAAQAQIKLSEDVAKASVEANRKVLEEQEKAFTEETKAINDAFDAQQVSSDLAYEAAIEAAQGNAEEISRLRNMQTEDAINNEIARGQALIELFAENNKSTEQLEKEQYELRDQLRQEDLAKEEAAAAQRQAITQASVDAISGILSAASDLANVQAANRVKEEQAQGEARLKRVEGDAEAEARIKEETEARIYEIEKQAFERQKAIDIAVAIINTASAVLNALAKGGPPPLNFILAASAGVIGALQIATISSQSFARGGYTGDGYGQRDESGFKPAGIVHEGEYVVPKKVLKTRQGALLTSRLESMRTGAMGAFQPVTTSYATGGFVAPAPIVQATLTSAELARAFQSIPLTVGVSEINTGLNRVQVQENRSSLRNR